MSLRTQAARYQTNAMREAWIAAGKSALAMFAYAFAATCLTAMTLGVYLGLIWRRR